MPKGKANKRYTGEFKQKVVEAMINENLSYRETARLYEINDHHIVTRWERIYLEEGAEGLYKEHRGRACLAGGTQKGRPPKLDKKVEEDLIGEVQRLRAEVDYLKKLNVLVLERELHEKKLK